jgi:hypothetical protein
VKIWLETAQRTDPLNIEAAKKGRKAAESAETRVNH